MWLALRSLDSASLASFCFNFVSCILSHTSSYSYTVASTFFSASICFNLAFEGLTFCARRFLLELAFRSADDVNAASVNPSSSVSENAAGRLRDGVSPTGLVLLAARENDSFILVSLYKLSSVQYADMSQDRRRINGPEESYEPVFEEDDSMSWRLGDPRNGGRSAANIRPICGLFPLTFDL